MIRSWKRICSIGVGVAVIGEIVGSSRDIEEIMNNLDMVAVDYRYTEKGIAEMLLDWSRSLQITGKQLLAF
jgi:hypothetical protein